MLSGLCRRSFSPVATQRWFASLHRATRSLSFEHIIVRQNVMQPDLFQTRGVAKPLSEEVRLSELKFDSTAKNMMVWSLESYNVPEDIPDVMNDLNNDEDKDMPIENPDDEIAKLIKTYKIKWLNESRTGKRLLVLDIDYTIIAKWTTTKSMEELMRPFLHEFLESAYQDYDIAFWSATKMMWIDAKLWQLGVTRNEKYKIAFLLDSGAMISLHTSKYGLVNVKPLPLIWGLVSAYRPENTIMIDDIPRNFLMNPQSGLRVRPFRNADPHQNNDRELVHLARYLKDIAASVSDFTELNHRNWKTFMPKELSLPEKKSEEPAEPRLPHVATPEVLPSEAPHLMRKMRSPKRKACMDE